MTGGDKKARRAYNAPERQASASRTREAIVRASRQLFEERGWSATTMRAVAVQADVSLKTVEAVFGTKAALLAAAVEYAIRGDLESLPMPQRESVVQIEQSPSARAMLELHAAHLRSINERSAQIAWVVEQAATDDDFVGTLWDEMNHNRGYAVHWATSLLLRKPGRRSGLRRREVEAAFWVALDWGTYRTLTRHAALTPANYETWLRRYYRDAFLPR